MRVYIYILSILYIFVPFSDSTDRTSRRVVQFYKNDELEFMPCYTSARTLHARLSLAAGPLLIVAAATGALWTWQEHWMLHRWGEGDGGEGWLMKIHQGDFLLGWLAPTEDKFYLRQAPGALAAVPMTKRFRFPLMLAMGFIGIAHAALGCCMLASPCSKGVRKQRSHARWLHHVVALLFVWPLAMTIITGAAYRLLRMQGFPKKGMWGVKWILHLHQGYVEALVPIFPLAMAAVILVLAGTAFATHPLSVEARQRCRQRCRSSRAKKLA